MMTSDNNLHRRDPIAAGCVDLLVAILRRAVSDAQIGDGHAARAWLAGEQCALYLEWLNLDTAYFRRLLLEVLGDDDDTLILPTEPNFYN